MKTTITILCLICMFIFGIPIALAQQMELIEQLQHSDRITSMAFTQDGHIFASASADGTIKLWDMSKKKLAHTISAHAFYIESIAIHPDGNMLASAGLDGNLYLWNMRTGEKYRQLKGHRKSLYAVAFSPDGKRLVSGGAEKLIRLWNVETGKTVRILKKNVNPVKCLSFHPAGEYLASGHWDNTINIWNIKTGKKLISLLGHSKSVYSIAFSADGRLLASADDGSTIILWNTITWEKRQILSDHRWRVTSVTFNNEGTILISGSQDKSVKLWNTTTGELIHTLEHDESVESIALHPNNTVLISGSHSGKIEFWNIDTGRNIMIPKVENSQVNSIAFSGDNQLLASGDKTGWIRIWDLVRAKPYRFFKAHDHVVNSLAFSPDSKQLISSGSDTIKIWLVTSYDKFPIIKFPASSIYSLIYSPDGSYFAGENREGKITLWEPNSGKVIRSWGNPTRMSQALAISPDGRIIVNTNNADRETILKFWDVRTGSLLKSLDSKQYSVSAIDFSPDGRLLASGGMSNNIKIWSTETYKAIHTLKGHRMNVNTLAFSPDGKFLASGGWDRVVKLWNTSSFEEIYSLNSHDNFQLLVDFSSDSRFLTVGSSDSKIKLYEPKSGSERITLIAIDQSDYLITTSDNYYTSSVPSLKSVAFRFGKSMFPFDQFDIRFNRPDIVLKTLGYAPTELIAAYNRAYQKRMMKMNFAEDMLGQDFHLPEISIISETIPLTTENKMLSFKIQTKDSKYLLDQLNVFVNDVPIYGVNGIDLRDSKVSIFESDISLELCNGRNKVQVSVLNDKGAESLKETFEITYDGEFTKPDLYIATIGVSAYVDRRLNLKYAAKDARDLTKLLAENKEHFEKIHTIEILDNDATKENIMTLKDKLKQTNVDDEVILFISGHGFLDNNLDYYFATSDIDFVNPTERGLSYEEIEGLLDSIPARKKLLLMDTCHSGEVDKEDTEVDTSSQDGSKHVTSKSFRNVIPISKSRKLGLSNSFQLMQELFANLSRGSGAVVISAAAGVEFALEDEKWQNGVFTYSILEGLKTKNADLNNDNEIRVSELKEYVTEKVQELTNGRQTPTSRQENLEFDFRVF